MTASVVTPLPHAGSRIAPARTHSTASAVARRTRKNRTITIGRLTRSETRKEGARMMVKVRFDYTAGDMYPFKAITIVDDKEIFGSADLSDDLPREEAIDMAWMEAERNVVEKVKEYLIGQAIKIPEPKEVEI
jgi:hypothetical protein